VLFRSNGIFLLRNVYTIKSGITLVMIDERLPVEKNPMKIVIKRKNKKYGFLNTCSPRHIYQTKGIKYETLINLNIGPKPSAASPLPPAAPHCIIHCVTPPLARKNTNITPSNTTEIVTNFLVGGKKFTLFNLIP